MVCMLVALDEKPAKDALVALCTSSSMLRMLSEFSENSVLVTVS